MFKHYKITTVALIAASLLFTSATAQYIKINQGSTPRYLVPASAHEGEDYISKTIILKVLPQYRSLCSSNDVNLPGLKAIMQQMGVSKFGKIYPNETAPVREYNRYGQKLVDISLIYEYTYTANVPLQQVLDKIASLGFCEYAEMHVIPKASYTVNDPSVNSQYHIAKISAPQAWDISKGDTNVVIGITDTGVEPNHPDLKANIKHNYNDKIDGIDNDGDGYIDNFSGWDVAMNDNNPTWPSGGTAGTPTHGIHVSGISAAVTDNSTGIAGVGFKCKFMPIKIADQTAALTASFTGIQYGASHGCKVINCSWGSEYWSQYGQDIINNATFNYDALVVAAAGNDGSEILNYPSYYQNVLSVAATTSTDKKASFSNYNYAVKISAPGNAIYSTLNGTSYGSMSGTSMASPVVAGAAAVVRSYFPSYNALQTSARLCVTADNIVGTGLPNSAGLYGNKLGSGRVNLYRALNDPSAPSVLMTTRTITDGNDDAPVALDTLRISGIYTNFLAPTTNLTATISVLTATGYVTLIPGTTVATLGAISTMGTGNNTANPFKVLIKSGTPLNTSVVFKITYNDGTYTSSETFDVVVNVDYLNVTVNSVNSSVTSRGRDGWNNDPPTQGLGFKYKGVNLMYDGGFMVGVPDSSVSDVARGTPSNPDFISKTNIRRVITGALSDFDTEGYMNDSGAIKPIGLMIHHKSFAWSAPPDSKYIMYKYVITNKSNSTLSGLYAGLCVDWDIQGKGGDSNKLSYDAANRMGYTWYTPANGLYGGIKLLSKVAPANNYSFDNDSAKQTGSSGIKPNSAKGFTNRDKYIALSTMRTDAGNVFPPGNDVMNLVSTGPITLNVGDSIEVAFALLAGDNLNYLKTSAINAQTRYDNMTTGVPVVKTDNGYALQTYPNPSSGNTTVDVQLAQTGRMELKLFDVIGQEVALIAAGEFSGGNHRFTVDVSKLTNGVYYYRLVAGDTKLVSKMMVAK
ncbi:MAG: S8 family peptidase [Bacteroidia bacterium]|nr:S8 family peptidase [Bacteroidia bacterium]